MTMCGIDKTQPGNGRQVRTGIKLQLWLSRSSENFWLRMTAGADWGRAVITARAIFPRNPAEPFGYAWLHGKGYLTIKGKTVNASSRRIRVCHSARGCRCDAGRTVRAPLIEKTRYRIEYQGLVWEVDEFEGENAGLVIAEVELADADQAVALPAWIGEEVTADPRYYNASLIANPFSSWSG